MSLAPPTRLGSYEIIARLGAGGMGEVYRARDAKLHRDVAIKVLPESVARDAERLSRFRREAQVLAALNHPHVGAIYGLDEADGVQFLVLELVEGETLADRLRRGPLPLNEAITMTRQICDAVASAHERGVVHRDLKPANIAVTADDRVKVLDFGLARAAVPLSDDQHLADSPTITAAGVTTDGVILGTAPYMSPEQAMGRGVDKRTDVFAVGSLLFEMLSGRRAFAGETIAETLANVIKGEPDWRALPAGLPQGMLDILRGTLQKDRKARIGDLSTVAFLLDRPGADSAEMPIRSQSTVGRLAWLAAGLTIGVIATTAVMWRRPAEVPTAAVTRFTLQLPPDNQLLPSRRAVALSPDGTRLAAVTIRGLSLRALAEPEAHIVRGTIGALIPVFSPDGESIVFWHDGALKRLTIGGASTVTLSVVGIAPNHLSWTGDTLLFTQGRSTIMRVSAAGGTAVPAIDLKDDGRLPSSVQLLSDGDTVLFTLAKPTSSGVEQLEAESTVLQSLTSGERTSLGIAASDAWYVRTGHIVYAQQGTLYAVPFDMQSKRLRGDAVPVVEGVSRATAFSNLDTGRAAQFAVSESGTLVYVPGPVASGEDDLILFDEAGKAEPLNLARGYYRHPRVSRDGSRIAFDVLDGREVTIVVHDRANPRSLRRLTFGGNNRYAVWSPDGQQVAFQSDREGDVAIFRQPAAGGPAERLTRPEPGVVHIPESWSPDGQVLLFSAAQELRSTLCVLRVKDRRVEVFGDVRDSYLPANAVFSPDGQWVAYQFAEREDQGEATAYIEPYPPNGTKHQVGTGGRPVWSRDGAKLFYIPNPSQWMVVNFRSRPELSISGPEPVGRWFGVAPPRSRRPFDLLPDGRVVAVGAPEFGNTDAPLHMQIVLNWFEELTSRVTAKP